MAIRVEMSSTEPFDAADPSAATREAAVALDAKLRDRDSRLLSDWPVESYLGYLDQYPKISCFSFISPAVQSACDAIRARVDEDGLAMYHQLVLLTLARRSRLVVPDMNLPDDVRSLCVG